ncbi:hypothetical protein VTL71DRAFT_13362 [Oculimacula yallundae]|uniref:Major facilitator superfamily (MFS) profile domain-containing protein n=1 Tax=Oculimacula yallundae TaxID=86028 RepID=A0ABR4CM95_9HELO
MVVASNDYSLQKSMSEAARSIFAVEAIGKGMRSMDLLLAILVYTVWYVVPPAVCPKLIPMDLKYQCRRDRCFYIGQPVLINLIQLSIAMVYNLGLDKPPPPLKDPASLIARDLKNTGSPEKLSKTTNEARRALLGCFLLSTLSCYTLAKEPDWLIYNANLNPKETLLLELHAMERSIYEVGLSHDLDIFKGKETRRVECLWACVNATNSWINVFLSIPPADYPGFSALTYSSMTHSFLTAYRLSTFNHVEWDLVLCLENLDVPSFLDEAGGRFGAVKGATNLIADADEVDPFTDMFNKIQLIRKSWEIKHASLGGALPQFSNDELFDLPMEFSDGDWLGDMLGSYMITSGEKAPKIVGDENITTPVEQKLQRSEDGYLEGYRLWVLVGCLTFAGFLLMLDESIISTAIPKITTDFGSKSFLVFFFIFELGAAQSPEMLITGRAVEGMGGSGLLNGAYGIIHGIAPIEKQPRLLGIVIGISLLGILSGPLIGGLLTEFASWRWCFYINIPSGGIAAVLLAIIPFPEQKNATTTKQPLFKRLLRLDLVGFFFFAPAAMMLIFAIEWGGTIYAWNSATIIGLFVGCGATPLVFVAWEYHVGAGAMIPLSIIRRRVIWSSCLYMLFFIGSALTAIFYLPLYFQTVRHASPTMSGVDLLPSIIATSLFSVVAGGLSMLAESKFFNYHPLIASQAERFGYYTPWAISGSVLAAIGTGLCSTFDPTTSIGVWIGFQIIMSAGRGLGFQTPIIAVQNHSSKEEISVVNALVVFSQYLGGALFLSLDKTVFTSALKHFLQIHAPDVDSQLFVNMGALGVHQVEPAAVRIAVVLAYSKAIERVIYLGTASAAFGLIFAFGMGWTNITKKAEADKLAMVNLEGECQGSEKSIDSESVHSSKKTTSHTFG